MYFFFHLLSGLIIGFLFGDILHDLRWVLPWAAGAILPDLIDKPLGYLVFGTVLNNGRIWFHSLLLFALVLALGIGIWKYRATPIGLGVAGGILSHQILDLMWLQPVTWFYPALGPFPHRYSTGRLLSLLMQELTNPWEWMAAGIIALGLVIYLHRDRRAKGGPRSQWALRVVLSVSTLLLSILSLAIILFGLMKTRPPLFGWVRPEEFFIGGILIALGAYLSWRWQRHQRSTAPVNG
jgi:membrane-bound metal-dependent hydrolase YbcI (DUF457 family)